MCIKNKDYELKGDYYSQSFKFLEIQINKCLGSKCKDQKTIDAFFD